MQLVDYIGSPGWSRNDLETAGNFSCFVVAVCEDTPTSTPAVDWLSPNNPSYYWTSQQTAERPGR